MSWFKEFEVECPHCGHIDWQDFKFEDDPHGFSQSDKFERKCEDCDNTYTVTCTASFELESE